MRGFELYLTPPPLFISRSFFLPPYPPSLFVLLDTMATAVLSPRHQAGLLAETRRDKEPQHESEAIQAHSIHGSGLSKPDPLAEFPSKLHSNLCWDSHTFVADPRSYVVHLTVDEVKSVTDATAFFKCMVSSHFQLSHHRFAANRS